MKILSGVLIVFMAFLLNAGGCDTSHEMTEQRIWWEGLNETWQELFLREMEMLGEKPTNEDLEKMWNLERFTADHYPLGETNLDALIPLKRLKELSAGSTHIDNINALAELDSLVFVNLADTPIDDLEPLRGHKDLESLYIQMTRVSRLTPINKCKKLQVLVMHSTEVTSIGAIMELPNLSILGIDTEKIPGFEIEQFKKMHPDCEVSE